MFRNVHSLGIALVLMLALSHNSVSAQQSLQSEAAAGEYRSWNFGTEVDVLPYVLGGYYASAFAGHNGWRYRGVASRSDAPGFMVSSGFEHKRTDAYALLTDRFFGSNRNRLQGIWAAGGGELWQGRIRRQSTSSFTQYDNFVLTAGGGYVWRLSKHFYLNPWSAIHVVVGGNRNIDVSGKVYQQPLVTPQASLKIGFIF